MRSTIGYGIVVVLLAGCGAMPSFFPFRSAPSAEASAGASSRSSSTAQTTTSHEIDGRPVDDPPPAARASAAQPEGRGGFGDTCTEMDECQTRLCFIGRRGNVGFCTHTCDDFMDCPMHWKCRRPSNGAHRVCMQQADD